MFFHYNNIIIAFYGVKKCGILKMTVLDLYRHKVKYNQKDIEGMYYPYSKKNAGYLYF